MKMVKTDLYRLYARTRGKTPQKCYEDDQRHPSGAAVQYANWMIEEISAFVEKRGRQAIEEDGFIKQEAFKRWMKAKMKPAQDE